MAKRASRAGSSKVTRDDLEQQFASLQRGMRGKVEEKRNTLVIAAAAGGVLVVLLVFLIGRRSGKKKTTLVEIRRV